jgi:transcriptional regulator with PAS, ATPase and Fis domain
VLIAAIRRPRHRASQVKKAVADAGGNQRIAAEALGIPRGTIWGWLQKINSK